MRKSFILVFTLLIVAGFYGVSFAGISTSPHDVVSWHGAATFSQAGRVNTGVCSYCHIPHSAKGDRLFPTNIGDSAAVSKTRLGTVAFLCAQCHSSLDTDFNAAHIDASNEMIFKALNSPNRAANDTTSPYDSHPTRYTSDYISDTANLGIADSTETTKISAKWPYMDEWGQKKRDIECTSCHNPHDWNESNRRNYLRVAYYDSGAAEYDSTVNTNFRNVCSYCHTGRDKSGIGLSNQGTHPVGNRIVSDTVYTMLPGYGGIWLDTLNVDAANPRFFKNYFTTVGASASKAGRAVGDRGAHLGPQGQFTCMSCHMPHAAPNSRDGVTSRMDSVGLVAGPLLVINNDAAGTTATGIQKGFAAADHWGAETAFTINSGESNLCEWCHGITPKKDDTNDPVTTTVGVMQKYAHPVNNYPTPTNDNETHAYISNLSQSEIYSSSTIPLYLRYPIHSDSTAVPWKNYEESGAPNSFTMGATRGTGEYLVCNSCHDVHLGQVGTPILRGPSSPQYCEDCHGQNPVNAGVSHPLKNLYGTKECDSTTEDGGGLPNYANLYWEKSRTSGNNGQGEVVCRTCHGGPFQTGVIHGGMGRFLLADNIGFAELCVNCHGLDTHTGRPAGYDTTGAWVATLRYGSASVKSANPSYYYKEGPSPVFSDKDPTELSNTARVGSHYIGQISAGRPWIGDSTYGWLGSTDTTLDHRGSIEDTTAGKWLDTTWFRPLASGTRRMWTTSRDGVGVDQYSIIGYIGADIDKPVIICLSCHTPHGASGDTTVGGNGGKVADDSSEFSEWSGELLLARNDGSYICYICHLPEATHPVNFPDTTHDVPNKHKSTGTGPNPTNRHDYVTRTDTTISIYDTADPNKVVRDSASIYKPANYPYGQMLCESCHSAHSANSRWGSYILEGDTTRASVETYTGAFTPSETGLHNKRPTASHTAADTVKAVNDRPTCEMCHPQGTE